MTNQPTDEQRAEFRRLVQACVDAEKDGRGADLEAHMLELVQFAYANGISENELEVSYVMIREGIA